MKILLLGKNGQVGEMLRSTLAPFGELVSWGREEARFEVAGQLAGRVVAEMPDIIVNAAAYTAVDSAESDQGTAFLVNADAAAALANAAKRLGAWLLHYSTDYVFDGRKPAPYTELDAVNPLSAYGRSKLAGDNAIIASGCLHLIFRVSWVYASGHANFPSTMLRLAKDRSSLNVVADQVGSPTSAGLIARITAEAINRIVGDDDAGRLSGIYNLAAGGHTNRAEMVRFIVSEANARGRVMALAPEAVQPVKTCEFPMPAARPLNSLLDTRKLRQAFGVDLPPWQDDMRIWVARELEGARP